MFSVPLEILSSQRRNLTIVVVGDAPILELGKKMK
jgi:hypothetical protein